MNATESPDKLAPTVIRGPMGTALKILGGIARWTWRFITITIFLVFLVFLLGGPSQPIHMDLEHLAWTILILFLLGVVILGWWREALAGLILFFVLPFLGALLDPVPGLTGLMQILAQFGHMWPVFVIPFLMLLSWLLHGLRKGAISPGTQRPALLIVLLLIVAAISIGAVIYLVLQFRFPANA